MIRTLGQGRSGTVYLALHRDLEEYRAVKQVSGSSAGYEQFRKEALLLKRLRHPGIPIVYDIEEDSQYSYLIEEFLEGSSLYDLVRERGRLNREAVITYGIQICDLVHYLHSAEDIPILHLDLQPRNLLVCHGQVKLLDFDHSDTVAGANAAKRRYGTPGYCAPEQRDGDSLGIYTDVYQIGAILYYLAAGHPRTEGTPVLVTGGLGAVIRRCLHPDASMRYASAREVGEELEALRSGTEGPDRNQSPPFIIAVAGSRPGAGATHVAIGLTAYLDRSGRAVLYEERNFSNDVRAMAETLGAAADSYGICTIFKLPLKPRYGEAVRFRDAAYPLIVRDYGTELEQAAADAAAGELSAVLLVRDGKWWSGGPGGSVRFADAAARGEAMERLASAGNLYVLYNRTLPGTVRLPEGPRKEGVPCYRLPFYENPFKPDRGAEACFRAVTGKFLPDGKWKRRKRTDGRTRDALRGGNGR